MTGSERRGIARTLAAALLVLLVSATAMADEPTAAQKETARRLMAEGRARRAANDRKGELEAFQAANDLMHVPTTGLELARAEIASGKLLEARETLLEVERTPPRKREPAPFLEARKAARELYDSLEGRIPALRVRVTGASSDASWVLTVDDTTIAEAARAVPVRVNPGAHRVRVTAGAEARDADVDVAEGVTKDISLDLTPTARAEVAYAPVKPPEPSGRSGTNRALIYGGFGLAIAGTAAGAITGTMAISRKRSAVGECVDDRCPPEVHDDVAAAKSLATVSTVAFIVGGAGATIGIAALLMGGGSKATTSTGATVHPWVSVGGAGLQGAF